MAGLHIVWSSPAFDIVPIPVFDRAHLDILCRVYGSTRQAELSKTDWSAQQKDAFILHQFNAQHDYYQKVYPAGSYNLIQVEGQVAGRLYLAEGEHDVRIIDIALLPEFRNLSLGSGILSDLQNYCQQKMKTLSIHVEQFNPAKNLYLRLGFVHAETYDEVYVLMKWTPEITVHGCV